MTVLVTGANGHIGCNLVRTLVDRGRPVRALIHGNNDALEGLDIQRVDGDVSDLESVRAATRDVDVVFHLAAVISISGRNEPVLQTVNVGGPKNIAQACLENGVRRLVHFSSTHALNEFPREKPIDETNEPAGEDDLPYDRSKAAGEREILAAVERGLDAVIVNPCGVIGPHDYAPSRMGQVLHDLYNKRLPGLVDGGYTWVDVRDVVDGALAAEARGRKGERYILASEWRSTVEIGQYAEAATGVKAPRFVTPMWLARASAPFAVGWARMTGTEAKFTGAALHALRSNPRISNQKAKDELGFDPRPVQQTVADTYAWFKEAGRLNG